ncbi:hypothetical protein KP509_23G049300 [Ceratopteris richardii]|uniref:Cytochrome P450 n=1 Tax=Ceratopteris richardii TaxID=49495 RepID=A0A8T2S2R6_CERRI|nr:hypothetical protein KP509_23G049300 [Ceratopteris richardii]
MTANTTLLLLQSRPLEKAIIEPPELVHILDDESLPGIGDFVPWLAFLDFFNSRRRWRAHRRIDALIESILAERRRLMAHCAPEGLPHDFLQDNSERKFCLPTTVEWAMSELLRHPECMKRLQEEVDNYLMVNDDHVQEMPYLYNILKEVLRLHPIAPLLVPRVAKFWPDRFLEAETDLHGQHYEYLPFGSGRRMCPGVRLGISVVQVTLANPVREFEWELPQGQNADSIDMSCKGGLGNRKGAPLLAIARRRNL